jgi:DNA-3-methyladenine glycosylase I
MAAPQLDPHTLASTRCQWATREPMIAYHDGEWGTPLHDDRLLFEFLILEGAQAGLSWETILKKRDNYRAAFDDFDPAPVAAYDEVKVATLMADAGIIRNRLKINAAIQNAQAYQRVQAECGSFDAYVWGFVGGQPRQNAWASLREVPAKTPEAEALSKDLLKRGFKFVGPTICYAFMQATGMVNDHVVGCFRHAELSGTR